MTSPEEPKEMDKHRTRRNVLAMAGLFTSTVVAGTTAMTKIAQAGWPTAPSDTSGSGTPSCFLSGTRIRTQAGETIIENLRVGDLVETLSGQSSAIKRIVSWEAERKTGEDWKDDVAPIKICRSALAPNVPHRDLYLSPLHALDLDGVLITARGLVNGRSIVRCSKAEAEKLSYFHIELEDHQAIFAEGTPVESLLGEGMTAFAPIWYGSRKSQLVSRLRSAISPWVDKRKVYDKVRDRLEVRGESKLAA